MKVVFANESEIPEHLKKDAVAVGDGTFTYEGDGIIKKNAELLEENKKHKALSDLVKGLDTSKLTPEKIREALAEHENASARETEVQARIQAAVEENSRKHSKIVTDAKEETKAMESHLERYLIDSKLSDAIAAEKGNPLFVAPVLRNRLKVVKEVKDGKAEYNVRVLKENSQDIELDEKGTPVGVIHLVQSAKKNPDFKQVFSAPQASGSGTPPEAGKPGTAPITGTRNLTPNAQGIIEIPRDQAKDASFYRQAVEAVKGDFSKVVLVDPLAAAAA